MTDTSQKIALITGASRGLGAALAEALCPTHHIIAVARTVGALEELDDRIKAKGGSATLAPMDVTSAEAMQSLANDIAARWGRLDLWTHTAVYAPPLTPANMQNIKDLQKSLTVNVTVTADLMAKIGPLLGQAGTALFFEDPRAGQKFFGSYGASKAAQIAMVQSWAVESMKTGPNVHVVTPSPMPTATRARFFPGEDRSKLTDIHTAATELLTPLGLI
jgi:NAD(P)-dependent dehydrogenase (short-subunit alcohol dehydrogenase family)